MNEKFANFGIDEFRAKRLIPFGFLFLDVWVKTIISMHIEYRKNAENNQFK
ncbi:MAG: hypothetical protein PF489_00935 [Salinivirgaceae bacterium]|jgi:hypothetical protein|nr:hypothetical protein [Salinivirgaceae bacterium]